MKVAWTTDIHLNFVDRQRAGDFCARLRAAACGAVLLGGDIAEAHDLASWLSFLDERLDVPIYFVLGNHDYYGGDVASVRTTARAAQTETLRWLPATGVVPLSPDTGLVGHGGWGDARFGDFLASEVILNDYVVIRDLREVGTSPDAARIDPLAAWNDKPTLQAKLHALGDDAADCLRPHLQEALERFAHVIVLTHVPPFRDACWHDGKVGNDDWLPGFTCKAIGDLLLETVRGFPKRKVTVLCGHTHGEGRTQPLPNLEVVTGGAAYGEPDFRTLDF